MSQEDLELKLLDAATELRAVEMFDLASAVDEVRERYVTKPPPAPMDMGVFEEECDAEW